MKTINLLFLLFFAKLYWAQSGTTLPTVQITPQFVANLSAGNEETSGLFFRNDTLFSINDSGNAPELKGINPTNGQTLKTWPIANAQNHDWEALTASPTDFFIGDIGNNMGTCQYFEVYKISINNLAGTDTLNALQQTYYLPDQVAVNLPMNAHNFDAEAFAYWNDSLHIFSKNWANLWTKHYVLPSQWQDTIAAQLVDSFFVDGLITDAAYNSNTQQLFLLGYKQQSSGLYNSFMWAFWGDSVHLFNGLRQRIELGSALVLSQTEGLCLTGQYNGFISGEQISSVITIPAKVHAWSVEEIMTAGIEKLDPGFYFFENTLYLPESFNEILTLVDMNRKVVLKTERGKTKYNLDRLPPGVYYLMAHDWYYKWLKNS